jgi:hypothetical protein
VHQQGSGGWFDPDMNARVCLNHARNDRLTIGLFVVLFASR